MLRLAAPTKKRQTLTLTVAQKHVLAIFARTIHVISKMGQIRHVIIPVNHVNNQINHVMSRVDHGVKTQIHVKRMLQPRMKRVKQMYIIRRTSAKLKTTRKRKITSRGEVFGSLHSHVTQSLASHVILVHVWTRWTIWKLFCRAPW